MIKIVEVIINLPKRVANCLGVNIQGFPTSAESVNVSWTLYSRIIHKGPSGIQSLPYYETVGQGELALTKEEYANWGADNSYLEDLVIAYLGLERDLTEDVVEVVAEPVAEEIPAEPEV
jgi:hypothetical protein